jgi:hypothetical protein
MAIPQTYHAVYDAEGNLLSWQILTEGVIDPGPTDPLPERDQPDGKAPNALAPFLYTGLWDDICVEDMRSHNGRCDCGARMIQGKWLEEEPVFGPVMADPNRYAYVDRHPPIDGSHPGSVGDENYDTDR